MGDGQKFLVLNQLRDMNNLGMTVPKSSKVPYCPVELYKFRTFFDGNKKYILRSSLVGEASKNLNSGRSQSIKEISSFDSFCSAHRLITSQSQLDEIYLQEQIDYETHLTGVFKNNVVYLENTEDDAVFCYFTESTYVGEIELPIDLFKKISNISVALGLASILFEIGIHKGELFIFQVMELPKDDFFVKNVFKKNRVAEVIELETSSQKFRVFTELKETWVAGQIRKKNKKGTLVKGDFSTVISNWRCIIHYFRVFSILYPERDFLDFYTWIAKSKSWIAKLASEHFEIAQKISDGQFLPQGFLETYDKTIFLGEGEINAEVGKDAFLLQDLNPQEIYGLPKDSLVITQSRHLLSHGYLAVVEQGHSLVGNIKNQLWSQLKVGKQVRVHFANEQFHIK